MSEESLWRTPYKIIEMYPYTEPGTEITGPLLGYRLVGFEGEYPEFTYGRHDYAENVGVGYPLAPSIYRGTYIVKTVDMLYGRDAKLELENTVRNYRGGGAVVTPLTTTYISRCMMETIYWVHPTPMDYSNAGAVFNIPIIDIPSTRVQMVDELIRMGFAKESITFGEGGETLSVNILTKSQLV